MTWLGILTFVVCVASSEQGDSLQCLSCESSVPHGCHRVAKCQNDNQVCAATVVNVTGNIVYRYHCQDYQTCASAQAYVLIGKRGGHAEVQCHQCCRDHHKCNQKLCARIECATCRGVKDPKVCRSHTLCQIGEACFTEVKNIAGTYLYFMSCQRSTACPVNNGNSLIGKRSVRGAHHSLPGHCMGCCYGKECNKHLCHGYEHLPTMLQPPIGVSTTISSNTHSSVTTASSSTTTSSAAATPSPPPPPAHTVAATTTSTTTAGVPTTIAAVPPATAAVPTTTTAVPTTTAGVPPITAAVPTTTPGKNITAGITTASVHGPTTTPAPNATIVPVTLPTVTTEPPCEDIEQDGFKCSNYDALHFCTDTGSAFYLISHQLCRKHCGFCTTDTNSAHLTTQTHSPTTSYAPKTTTSKPTTTTTRSTTTTTQLTTASTPTTIYSTQHTTSDPPCVDNELDDFRCADYDSTNFCTDPSSFAHLIAYQSCRKHCGFCVPDKTTPGSYTLNPNLVTATSPPKSRMISAN